MRDDHQMPVERRGSSEDYVEFGEVARGRLGMQCQYSSRYLTGIGRSPRLAEDLRWHGGEIDTLWRQLDSSGDYHRLRLHRDDVDEFVDRVIAHRRAVGAIA